MPAGSPGRSFRRRADSGNLSTESPKSTGTPTRYSEGPQYPTVTSGRITEVNIVVRSRHEPRCRGLVADGGRGHLPDRAFAPSARALHPHGDRKSTRLNSSHLGISYA